MTKTINIAGGGSVRPKWCDAQAVRKRMAPQTRSAVPPGRSQATVSATAISAASRACFLDERNIRFQAAAFGDAEIESSR